MRVDAEGRTKGSEPATPGSHGAGGPGECGPEGLQREEQLLAGMLLKAPSHTPLVIKSRKAQEDRATVTATGGEGDASLNECAVQGPSGRKRDGRQT